VADEASKRRSAAGRSRLRLHATEQVFRAPVLVVEVLSPATQGYDRSQKFALYRRLPSLK